MAITGGTQIASSGSKTAGASYAGTTSAAAAVGDLLLLAVVMDNESTGNGAASNATGVTDGAGNTWAKVSEYQADGGVIDGGVACALFYCKVTAALSSGATVTVAFGASTSAKAFYITKFSSSSAVAVESSTGGFSTIDQSAVPALTLSGLDSREHLFFRVMATEAAPPRSNAYIPSTGFTLGAEFGTTGQSAATNVWGQVEYMIATGTGGTSQATPGNGAIYAHSGVMLALYETGGGDPPPDPPAWSGKFFLLF
jgi:hypothetical protein